MMIKKKKKENKSVPKTITMKFAHILLFLLGLVLHCDAALKDKDDATSKCKQTLDQQMAAILGQRSKDRAGRSRGGDGGRHKSLPLGTWIRILGFVLGRGSTRCEAFASLGASADSKRNIDTCMWTQWKRTCIRNMHADEHI